MQRLNIVFAGTPAFGLPCLNALWHSQHTIIALYTQPDRNAGRGHKLRCSAIKNWALTHAIPVYQPCNFKDAYVVDQLAALQPDLMVVIAYGLILPESVLTIPHYGCLNVHASLLPRWRGASPIVQVILHGELHTGITIMRMTAGMDTGPVATTVAITVATIDNTLSLSNKLSDLAVVPLIQVIEQLATTGVEFIPQDNALATYAPKIHKEDARINWNTAATVIERQIRAFVPWPVAYTYVNNELMRIYEAEVIKTDPVMQPPGMIINIDQYGMLI